jgi:hypothetical protein
MPSRRRRENSENGKARCIGFGVVIVTFVGAYALAAWEIQSKPNLMRSIGSNDYAAMDDGNPVGRIRLGSEKPAKKARTR